MNPRNRSAGRRRRNSSSGSESEGFEVVPSPAKFIPEDPGSDYNIHDQRANLRDKYRLKCLRSTVKVNTSTYVLAILSVGIAVVLMSGSFAHTNYVNEKITKYLPLLVNTHINLRERYHAVCGENRLLKAQIVDLIRWRETQEEQLKIAIESAIEKYEADKIGQMDFALESAGGYVTSTPNTVPYQIHENRLIGFLHVKERSNPQFMLQPGILPGQCFAFEGSKGRIRIMLSRKVHITNVTLEHVPRYLVDDDGWTAPREFQIIGLSGEKDQNGKVLGSFMYKIDGKSLQTFQVPDFQENPYYNHIEVRVLSNYGHQEYTCIYRLRVHGKPKY